MSEKKTKKPYNSPELRVYGSMGKLTRTAVVGLYPDWMGMLQWKPVDWMMMMMVMS